MFRLFSLIAISLAMVPLQAVEAKKEAVEKKRPKICLVLSGGGARGAAHIGVIKVLEELRIPIDCIAGTSMGALVGGAYASGVSVEEMEKLAGALSNEKLFYDTPPREELNIRRKQEDYKLLTGPEIGLASVTGTNLPKGIVTGVQLEMELRKISAQGYRDFNQLPIQYRAVATNLVTGKAEVFDRGELASVMRASMSVPVAIAPVEIDGKLLVDGMLTDNLPVDVAHTMGADIIIAVNVGTPLAKKEELGSILGVAGQMISILTEQNVQNSIALLKPTDILISPELGDFNTGDFDHLSDVLPIGEKAAKKATNRLSKLSLSKEEYELYRKTLVKTEVKNQNPIDEIRFENLKYANSVYLNNLMNTKKGTIINNATLDHDLRILYGTGDFEHVHYNFLEDDKKYILVIDAEEKSWGPNYFRFGIGLASDFNGNAEFNIAGQLRKTWMNSLGAELISDIQIGSVNKISSEFYQPLSINQNFFISPMFEIKQNSIDVFAGSTNVARYVVEKYRVGFDTGVSLNTYGEIRAGVRKGVVKPSLKIGPSFMAPDEESIQEGGFVASLFFDKLNNATFVSDGWKIKANLYNANDTLGADDSYTKWDTQGMFVHSFAEHTFNIFGAAGGSLEGSLPYYDQHKWGGFLRQSGYQNGQFLVESFVFGRFMYYSKLTQYPAIMGTFTRGIYAGVSLEAGKMNKPFIEENTVDTLISGSIFLGASTPLGPLYFGYGQAEDSSNSFYLFLGLPY